MTERKGNSCRHLDFTGLFGSIHLINNYYNLFTLDLKIQREKHHGVPKQLLTFVLMLLTLMVCASGVQQKPQDCHSCFQTKLASRARDSLSLWSGVKGQLGGAGYTAGSCPWWTMSQQRNPCISKAIQPQWHSLPCLCPEQGDIWGWLASYTDLFQSNMNIGS